MVLKMLVLYGMNTFGVLLLAIAWYFLFVVIKEKFAVKIDRVIQK